jgi:CMP-N,N'-diacetyllegionaminic acid synthase
MFNALVVIPARGGSKGVPGKNIKSLGGKPLIGYTIDVARHFFADADICVSSDDEDIIDTVERSGLEVPFRRPAELAQDATANHEVLLHALDFFLAKGKKYDTVIMLQPTSPFRTVKHLGEAIELYTKEIDMVVSVTETAANPYYTVFEEAASGFLIQSKPSEYVTRQECPAVYAYNGAIYIINVDTLRQKPLRKFEKIVKYKMEEIYSADIDTPLDWMWCEFLLSSGLIKNE